MKYINKEYLSYNNVKTGILSGIKNNVALSEELDNSYFPTDNVANNQNLKYNTINEAIIADPRKEPYAKYNTSIEFFNLDYDRMKKAIAIGSKYSLEAQEMGLDSYSFSDDKYVYDFDILNKNNNAFGITNVETIDNDVRSDTDERIKKQDNGLFNGGSLYESRYNNSDIKSVENGTTSNNFPKLPTREQGQQRSNENRQVIKESIGNSKELDNSSFSYDNQDIRYSQNTKEWNEYLKENIIKNKNILIRYFNEYYRNLKILKKLIFLFSNDFFYYIILVKGGLGWNIKLYTESIDRQNSMMSLIKKIF